MPFDLKSKNIFLTYSQVQDASHFTRDRTAHLEFVSNLFGPPERYRLGQESHADGGIHFHCYVGWGARIRVRDGAAFDFEGSHPNFEGIRRPRACWDYTGKDGEIIHELGEPPPESGHRVASREAVFESALDASDEAGFLEEIKKGAPRDFILYHDAIARYAERVYQRDDEPYSGPSFTADLPEQLEYWVSQSGIDGSPRVGRPLSLIIWGPSRTGKTVWARSLGKSALNLCEP